ncbi:MAG: GntR family transcriptional regulator [Anaerolineae bacterium]|nr:GntR family transcriptional regulator [Anaerolineae bacterium]
MNKRDGKKATQQQINNGADKLSIAEGIPYAEDADVLSTLKLSLADRVANYLREAIFMGKIAPGEQLREVPLSKMLGVSRGPIREALNKLEREGLVTIPRNGRTIVARLTREDFDEVYSLRLGLERVAMQYTIRNATPDELDEMQRLVDLMIERVNEGISEKEAADLDLQFHDVLYQASHHKRLQSVWSDLRPQIYIFLLSRNVADSDFRIQLDRHQEIVNVIRAKDVERAMTEIETHLQVAYTRILKTYEFDGA